MTLFYMINYAQQSGHMESRLQRILLAGLTHSAAHLDLAINVLTLSAVRS